MADYILSLGAERLHILLLICVTNCKVDEDVILVVESDF